MCGYNRKHALLQLIEYFDFPKKLFNQGFLFIHPRFFIYSSKVFIIVQAIRCLDIVKSSLYKVVNKLVAKCSNDKIGWSRPRDLLQPITRLVFYKLHTTTCSKQDVRLAETDHVVCFSQSCRYYTLLLLCLLREQVFVYYVETPY